MNNSTHQQIRINGTSASPEAQQALQRITENLVARGVDFQANEFDLMQELEVLSRLSALEIQPHVQPSHLPIIGGIVTRLKQAVHQLVLFYVRNLAAQQNAFNAQVVRILSRRDVAAQKPVERLPAERL